jgi:hypothetical protein
MDVAYQLDCEWPLLARTDVARAFPRWQKWQPELRRFGTPRQLLLFLHSAPAEQTDPPLLALLALAREEPLAGRTLLQVLLPALKTRADRIIHPSQLREEVWELLLYSAWEAICCYPLERRRARVAANLVLQVVHRTTRELRRTLHDVLATNQPDLGWLCPASTTDDDSTATDESVPVEQTAPRARIGPEAVVLAGVAAKAISPADADLILRTRVDGFRLRVLARTLGVNYDALLKRRQRAESTLRTLLLFDADVRKEPVLDPVSHAGTFLLERHRHSRAAPADPRPAARAA